MTLRPESSVPALLANRAAEHPDDEALLEKVLGRWISFTWSAYVEEVQASALGLEELGVGQGDAVAIVAENSPEWIFADLGIQTLGAFTVGIFATAYGPEVAYILEDCRAKVVIVGDQEQADKVIEVIEAGSTSVQTVVYIDQKGVSAYDEEYLVSFQQVRDSGRIRHRDHPQRFDELLDGRDLDETCLVGYTSGTTGLPKGVMISHRNMVGITKSFAEAFPMKPGDRIVAWVSMAHPAIRGPQIYTPFRNGALVAFPEETETFQDALYEIAPTYIMCPPRYLEIMSAEVRIRVAKSSLIKRHTFGWGFKIGERAALRRLSKGRIDFLGRVQRRISWLLSGKATLEKLGLDKVKWPMAGGAAISADLTRFFHSLGFELRQVYGQAETCGVPFAQYERDSIRFGTAGKILPGMEAKISADGELLLKGVGVFQGYLGKPEKTAEVLDQDGWFHTGDLAEFTEDNELVLLDRESAIMTLTSGTQLAPTEIENSLKFSPYVSEAVLIADGRARATALIQLELGTVSDWAQRHNLPYTTFHSLTEFEAVRRLIEDEIADTNQRLNESQQITDFRLLPKELDVDDDELTPTRKVKRRVINEKFGDLIASMYEEESTRAI